jgi:hypothetical protein
MDLLEFIRKKDFKADAREVLPYLLRNWTLKKKIAASANNRVVLTLDECDEFFYTIAQFINQKTVTSSVAIAPVFEPPKADYQFRRPLTPESLFNTSSMGAAPATVAAPPPPPLSEIHYSDSFDSDSSSVAESEQVPLSVKLKRALEERELKLQKSAFQVEGATVNVSDA